MRRRKVCPTCKNTHYGPYRSCSLSCGYEYRKSKHRKQRKCVECDTVFWPSTGVKPSKFCSRTCYIRKASERRALVKCVCHECGAAFKRTVGAIKRATHLFCSRRCAATFHRGANSPAWRGGSDPNRGTEWLKLAETIRKRDSYECQWCGKSEAHGEKLSVDHIKPWRSFTDKAQANDPRNLISLCRKCHSRKGGMERKYLKGNVVDMLGYIKAMTAIAAANAAVDCRCHEVWENRPDGR
jgi:5-methylcytosine-specific restriction endonuclease McrA